MTLRAKIIVYFVALHVVLAGAAVFVLMGNTSLLFVVEVLFAISVIISYRLVRALFVPLDLLRTGAELISEREFTSRFTPVGQPEMDALIRVYNEMIDRLRDERLTAEEQQQLLQRIVQASPSGIAICDFDGNIQQMNPAAQKLVSPELLDQMKSIAAGESRLLSGYGAQRLKVWRTEFRDRGFLKTFFLIEELTDELRLSEKAAYEKLIRMMSHEVNNSVGAVRSLLESILRYARDIRGEDREDFTAAITVASSRIDSLNRFMRDFAEVVRIPPPHRTRVDISAVVREIASLLKPEVEERHIDLRVTLDGSEPVDADRAQIEQVILNVLRNAIEAVGQKGTIDVAMRHRSLVVIDSGPGIPPEIRAELFNPFFSTKRDGRGLGLTIVQEILTNHGFGFSLETRQQGGAEFRIRF
jgi:two-component system nitrogen regulation sensor histidine kinase NtrY